MATVKPALVLNIITARSLAPADTLLIRLAAVGGDDGNCRGDHLVALLSLPFLALRCVNLIDHTYARARGAALMMAHQPIPEQGKWLKQIVTGYFNYHAVPTNGPTLTAFRFHITNLWQRALRQRSQKDWTTGERIARLANDWLPDRKSFTLARCALCSQTPEVGEAMGRAGGRGTFIVHN